MEPVLEKIYSATLQLLVPLTTEETYETITKEAMKLVNGELGSILLEQKGELVRVYATSQALYQIRPRKRGYMYTVYKTNKPKFLSGKQIAKIHPQINIESVRSDIIVPLSYREKAIGVLTVMSRKAKHFTENDLALLKFFGPLATLALMKTQLYVETKNALRTRDLFISMASHELKTPLTAIYAYLQLMQIKVERDEILDVKWIETLVKEITRLKKLVNELLQVDQIKTGDLQYHRKQCRLTEIINRAIADFIVSQPEHQIAFKNHIGGRKDIIFADYDKLIQVILNLLHNAAKFSPKQSTINISIEKQGNDIYIKIRDKGKGIPKDDLPNIFDGFYRGRNGSHEGMGLGLYLTKKIIDEHHGTITINSQVNKGTTVAIALPSYTNGTVKTVSRS